ncbi:MAG: hypothetical protein HDR02_06625 [Lachnospiraceae bacterium]|nr:hypothetical protein [Lachnospiraceae bacterium]
MGKKDLLLKTYLSNPVRYADVYNGSVFGGAQVLDASQLEEAATVVTKADGSAILETTCDIAMRQKVEGGLFALWILENQEEVDYGMPVRILLREALEYDRQVKALKRRNEAEYREGHEGEIAAGEYLYKVRKSDRIHPVCTLVIYWGKHWDGPRSLHEFLDFSGYGEGVAEEFKKLIPEYPLHILNLNEENDYSGFRTPLRTVFELYARRADKGRFLDYVNTHEECQHLDVETYGIIRELIGIAQVRRMRDRSEGEEEQDMWKAVEDLIEDGRTEGRAEGKIEKANLFISIIGNMMERLHCTLEEACEIAGQSVEEYKQARELLSN